jgi:hypothetical protein
VYPVVYVIPVVEQLPLVSHPPVNLNNLTPIWGFFGSPHNLNANAFEIESNNGSLSQVFSTEPGVTLQVSQTSQSLQEEHFKQAQPSVQAVIGSQFDGVDVGVGVGVTVGVTGLGATCCGWAGAGATV